MRGQWIAVHLPSGTVVVRTAARTHDTAASDSALTFALIRALVARANAGS